MPVRVGARSVVHCGRLVLESSPNFVQVDTCQIHPEVAIVSACEEAADKVLHDGDRLRTEVL